MKSVELSVLDGTHDATSALIRVENARRGFRQANGKEVLAIEDLTFDIAEGDYVAIVGPTGAGKSVFFDCLTGLKSLHGGTIEIAGEKAAIYRNARQGRISRIFQEDRLLPWLSAVDNAALGLQIQGIDKAERRAIAGAFLDLVGLSAFKNALPRELSGGMRQRVNIARAFATDPEIVLLDEAFSALDDITAARLREDFKRVAEAQGKTCIIVTHSIEEAIFLAKRILVFSAPAKVIADIRVPAGTWESKAATDDLKEEIRRWIAAGARKT